MMEGKKMDWQKYNDKPLVFFESPNVGDICQHTAYQPGEEAEGIFNPSLTPQSYLFKLLEQEELYKEALSFMSCAVNQRVRIWWGYVCIKETMDEVNAREYAAPDPKKMMEEVANDPAHADLMNFKLEDFLPPPMMHDGVNLNDPTAWPAPSIGSDGQLKLFPEPIHSDPNRVKLGIEEFISERSAAFKTMTPEEVNLFKKMEEKQVSAFAKMTGMSTDQTVNGLFDHMDKVNGPKAKSPFESLGGKFDKSEQAIAGKMDEMKKHIEEMKGNLPKKKPKKQANSSRASSAIESAKDWVIIPSDENARGAFDIGKKCKNAEKPAGLLAQSAFWSGTNIAPPGGQAVPPPAPLAARGVFTALILASNLKGGERKPPERLVDYIVHGIEVAQGIDTWEDKILPENRSHPWAGRTGFGRGYEVPDDNQDNSQKI